jgi:Pentapeptide repeats (8 copies)
VDESSSPQPQQKISLVEVAKRRIAQPKVWIPTAFVVAFLLAWSLFNLMESTLFPLSLKARDWTGLGADSTTNTERDSANKVIKTVEVGESSKTLWDWLSVLGVPLTLALLGFWFQALQQKQAEEEAKVEKEIAETARKEEAIQAYFDRLSDLLVDKNLIAITSKVQSFEAEVKAKEEGSGDTTRNEKVKLPVKLQVQQDRLDAAVDVIRARTLAILRRLENDADRKSSVMHFLLDAEVIQKLKLSLRNADLKNTDLRNANLGAADLTDANLIGANLIKANLIKANLSRAKFPHANLSRAILFDADLKDAIFIIADLSGAILNNADLSGADLTDADLSGAILDNADLSGAKNLTEAQLTQAKLCQTKLPPGISLNPDRDCEELEELGIGSLRGQAEIRVK